MPAARTGLVIGAAVAALWTVPAAGAVTGPAARPRVSSSRTLDGSDNNPVHPAWGKAGISYLRVAPAAYADGVGAIQGGPDARAVSNRIFNDDGQNLFSETGASQWAWAWGQFVDHDLGLGDETPAESVPIPFSAADPLESFTNDLGSIGFARTPAAPATASGAQRQQVNTISSYLDASNVYGGTQARLEWLRDGPVDGDLADNGATLFLPGGYLPAAGARGDAGTAPPMDLMGRLLADPGQAAVAGDVRANENIALTAIQTMFAREHNRIVANLPATMAAADKFAIARRVVGAEVQYVTYNEFLPALGVRLPAYRGYNPRVNPTLSNEFATVGYRAHSMVHGEFDVDFGAGDYTEAQLADFRSSGIRVVDDATEHAMKIPLTVAFGNPDLLQRLGLGDVLASLGHERQYRNDEQIDNTMRSVLFGIPRPGTTDPAACQSPVVDPRCFSGVTDLGATDIMRARDHGIPTYNDLRRAYGLPAKRSFTAITGETTDVFGADPLIDPTDPLDDPNILDFVQLRDGSGAVIDPADTVSVAEDAVSGTRRSTLAARLRAIYGSVDKVDAFVGMMAERHLRGSDLGELQSAMWRKQFTALRDGDRFFYATDPVLRQIERSYGISFRRTLSQLIQDNSGATVSANVFTVPASPPPHAPPPPPPSSSSTPARRRATP